MSELHARFYGGKRHMPVEATHFKLDAEETAKKIRSRGGRAKVVKRKSKRYDDSYVVYQQIER